MKYTVKQKCAITTPELEVEFDAGDTVDTRETDQVIVRLLVKNGLVEATRPKAKE